MRRKASVGNWAEYDNNVWRVVDHFSNDYVHTTYVLQRRRGQLVLETDARSDKIVVVR